MSGDTGALGIYGIAYTAQLGNGITASLSFEDNGQASGGRGHFTDNFAQVELTLGGNAFDNKGQQHPDVVGALRIDQAWGYAQVSAALHDASGGYYGAANSTLNGHPSDKFGFAVTGGFTLNDILGFKGDTFGMQACYAVGASGYCTRATGAWQHYSSGNNAGFGWLIGQRVRHGGPGRRLQRPSRADHGVGHQRLRPASVVAEVAHLAVWRLRRGRLQRHCDDHDQLALAGRGGDDPAAACRWVAVSSLRSPSRCDRRNSCSPDFSWWQLGSRTQWNPHPDLDIGVDVLWTHLNTAYKGTATLAANGARPAGPYADRRPGRPQRDVPHPEKLPALSGHSGQEAAPGGKASHHLQLPPGGHQHEDRQRCRSFFRRSMRQERERRLGGVGGIEPRTSSV